MFTRRQALQIAAAATTAAAVPFAVSPAEAAALLDQPADFDPGPGRGAAWGADLSAPVRFAESLDGVDWDDWFENGAAEDMALYKQAVAAMVDLYPELRDPPSLDHPFNRIDEAAMAMWVVSWMAGVRAGAAYEHLRLALVAPRQQCRRCHGHGRLWAGTPYRFNGDGTNDERCPDCGGRGWVPTPAPRLDLAAN